MPPISKLTLNPKSGTLESEQWVNRPIAEVFEFFSDAHNLEKITPDILKFQVLSMTPSVMGSGTVISYRLRVRGIPLSWKSLIEDWKPPYSFSDRQIQGPYRLWVHRHEFLELDGWTLIRDRVEYRLPFHFLAGLPMFGWVANDLKTIFEYRQKIIREIF